LLRDVTFRTVIAKFTEKVETMSSVKLISKRIHSLSPTTVDDLLQCIEVMGIKLT